MCTVIMSPSDSCKRLRAATGNESNSWHRILTTQRCSFPGCSKPPHANSRSSKRLFCGAMHRDFFMNNLVPGTTVLLFRNESQGNCMLPGCSNKAQKDQDTAQPFDFCGKAHMLELVKELTKVWSLAGRLCGLAECSSHVYVEDSGKCHRYCGMNHSILAAKREGAAVKTPEIAQGKTSMAIEDSLLYGKRGYHHKICDSQLERLLKEGRGDSSDIVAGINIYEFHPWEIVSKFGGFRPRFFLLDSVTRGEKLHTVRKTKEGFTWKQSGQNRPRKNPVLQTRYLTYMLSEGDNRSDLSLSHVNVYADYNHEQARRKAEESNRQKCARESGETEGKPPKPPQSRWRMHEITICDSSNAGSTRSIIMIFQDKCGEPVWPPYRQGDHFDAEESVRVEGSIQFSTEVWPPYRQGDHVDAEESVRVEGSIQFSEGEREKVVQDGPEPSMLANLNSLVNSLCTDLDPFLMTGVVDSGSYDKEFTTESISTEDYYCL